MIQDPYQRQTYPLLLVISGPSGVGKDSIVQRMMKRRPEDFFFVVTATDRDPRDDEVDGVDYIFLTNTEFERMKKEDELLEYAIVYDQYKGVPKQHVRDALATGKDVIMRLDVQGTETVKGKVKSAITIFLSTTSEEELVSRLQNRDQDSPEDLEKRIGKAKDEMVKMQDFDYCVVNADGEQEAAVDQVLAIIDAAHCQVKQTKIDL